MIKPKFKKIILEVLDSVGGEKNIFSFSNCQTRLRINVKDTKKISKKKLANITSSFGNIVSGKNIQIVFGPGKVVDVARAMTKITSIKEMVLSAEEIAQETKEDYKSKNTSKIQVFLGKFSNIFAPLIIGFVGVGLLSGIASIMKSIGFASTISGQSWIALLNLLLSVWKFTFLVIVGYRTSEVFGGSGVIGAVIAGLYIPAFAGVLHKVFITSGEGLNFLGINIADPAKHWLTQGFRPNLVNGIWKFGYPNGSVFGVMISATIVGKIQNLFRKFIPDNLDMIFNPTLTLLVLLILNFTLIIPFSGMLFIIIAWLFKTLYANPLGAGILAGLFLTTVVFGVHQGFVPVYIALVDGVGVNALFPILALAGAAQVGTGIALYLKAKKGSTIRKQISGSIIPAFLGIGEPMIYGVTLPRVRPFITASLGAAVAGVFIGSVNKFGPQIVGLNTLFGPSGILATPLMTTPQGNVGYAITVWLIGLLVAYVSGFIITWLFGTKNIDLS